MGKFDQWQTTCPRCGAEGSLIVTKATLAATGEVIHPNAILDSDGFGIDPSLNPDSKDCSTEDERVQCSSCHQEFDLSDLEIEKGKKYTVVGFYSDDGQLFVDHRIASSPQEAVFKTKLYRKDCGIAVVEVFEGHIRGVLENKTVEYDEED